MSAGKVLVVLPTLGDRIEHLRETLDTIDAARAEVDLTLAVVLPDGADAARELADEHGAVVVTDPRRGISEAINAGIGAATDETYYAWMGDDDLYRPHGLKVLRELLERHQDAVVAYGGCEYIDPEGRVIGISAAGRLAQFLLPWGPCLVPHPGAMIRLDAMRESGLFDPTLRFAMDLDMFLRMRRKGRFVCTRRPVSAFRWHPDSLTVSNRKGSSDEAARVKARHLPAWLRPVSPLWHEPVKLAAALAARAVNRRARALAAKAGGAS